MKIYKLTFIGLLLILFAFNANAITEDKYVQGWVQLKVNVLNATVLTPNILEPNSFSLTIDKTTNATKTGNFSFIMKAQVECTANDLTNLSEKLIDTCNQVSDYTKTCGQIFQTNTELSGQIATLQTKVDGAATCQNQLAAMQTQLTNAQNSAKSGNTQNNIGWFVGGALVAIAVYYFYNNSKRRAGPESYRGASQR